jgi:heptosyltransferase-1
VADSRFVLAPAVAALSPLAAAGKCVSGERVTTARGRIDLLGTVSRVFPARRFPVFDPARLHRLLIVKLSSIGDVVQSLPVAMALRRRRPRSRLTWAVHEQAAPLVLGHPAIDRVVVVPRAIATNARRWRAAVRDLRAESYDLALDLQGLLKSSLVVRLSRARLQIAHWRQREGAQLLVSPVSASSSHQNAVEEYLATATALGAPAHPVAFGLSAHAGAAARIERVLAESGIDADVPLSIVNPSASTLRKTPSVGCWSAIVAGLARLTRTVLIGARGERDRNVEIRRRAGDGVVDLTGRTGVDEMVAVLARAAVHVAADTGTLHVAAALGRPLVGIYGPTPAARLRPYGTRARVVWHPEACFATCPTLCPRRRCIEAVTPEEVIALAAAAITEPAP